MSKSLGNGFLPEELFTGNHPLLEKAYAPITVKFFMLQTHYRSTLDFSNEALQASEKGLKRLWDAYEVLQKLNYATSTIDKDLNEKVTNTLAAFDESMNDDFNTAKVLANMFELVPTINSFKDGLLQTGALSEYVFVLLQQKMKTYLEDIFGLQQFAEASNDKLADVMNLLIEIRKEAKVKKDFATSDKIRNQLTAIGIAVKDEKDGSVSWGM
jgi:cysteinyl-tRNA synthetase